MANSIKETQRLVKRVLLTNLGAKDGEFITPLVSGQHGIGKSQICKQVAKDLGGHSIVIEASMLSEGDAVGLPVVSKNSDGSSEVTFVPHKAFAAVLRLEKEYYERAKTGFLNGEIMIDSDGDTVKRVIGDDKKEKYVKVSHRGAERRILDGDSNAFKFGEELDFNDKLRLLESGEIKPVVILIDELNRTENQTMKELMNIVLNKTVNGYDLPWWCFVVAAVNPASQNSTYAVNEMDNAQLDRFLKFVAITKTDDWVDYCLDNNVNRDLIQAVTATADLLVVKDKSLQDETEMTPSPRSWSMIGTFMDYMIDVNNSAFFTNEERSSLKSDFQEVVFGKVGPTAGRAMLTNLENKKNMVKPSQIINGESAEIDASVLKILNEQKSIQKKITMDSVMRYLCETVNQFETYKSNNDMKVRAKYTNFGAQIKQYVHELDSATRTLFLKRLIANDCKTTRGELLYSKICSFLSKDTIEVLRSFQADKLSVSNED